MKYCLAARPSLNSKLKRIRFSSDTLPLVPSLVSSLLLILFSPLLLAQAVHGRGLSHAKRGALLENSRSSDLIGLNAAQLIKRFPTPPFKRNSDSSQIRWHGTDTSTVLELRYQNNKVSQVRFTTHYGYPRKGTKSSVAIGAWLSTAAKSPSEEEVKAFKRQLKQH